LRSSILTGEAGTASQGRIRAAVLAAFLVLAAATILPIASVRIPPLADYINHLARMHAVVSIGDDPLLSRFYLIHWQLLPNLMMDLVVPPLMRLFDIYTAGRIYLLGVMLMQAGGVVALSYALFRRLSPAPLLAFVFLYNYVLLLGLVNYGAGVAIALWASAAWIGQRELPPWRRAAVSAVCIVALFVCHLFGLGLYGFTLACYECWKLWSQKAWTWPRRRLAGDLAAFCGPLLLIVPLMLLSPTSKLAGWYTFGEAADKLDGVGWTVRTYFDHWEYALGLALIAGALVARRLGALRMHPMGWFVLAFGAVLYIAMPRVLFGSWGADYRLTIGLLFILLGCFSFEPRRMASVTAFLVFLVVLVTVRLVAIEGVWRELDADLVEFRASVDLMPPGSRILVAAADKETGTEALNMSLSHAACMAMIHRSSFVSDAFSRAGMQILVVRPEFEDYTNERDDDPPTVAQLRSAYADPNSAKDFFWDHWWEHYDYVYVLYGDGLPQPPVPHLDMLRQARRFALFAITPPPPPPG
jgi:hypothetical protein